MAKTGFKSVDEYIASQSEAAQGVLERLRRIIRKALPEAEEVISYQIPAYKLNGRAVIYFAGWRQHYSLYPATGRLGAAFEDDLAPFEVSKGTIRFPFSEPIPVMLIEAIAKFRTKEVAEREKAKAAAPKGVRARRRQTGRFEVYVQSFPAPGGGKWQISKDGGWFPRWRRDGRELFYYARDERLMAVPVRSATGLDVGDAVPLFEVHLLNGPANAPRSRHQYDVARDGQRFLLNVPVEDAAASSITVVLNWTAGLKK